MTLTVKKYENFYILQMLKIKIGSQTEQNKQCDHYVLSDVLDPFHFGQPKSKTKVDILSILGRIWIRIRYFMKRICIKMKHWF